MFQHTAARRRLLLVDSSAQITNVFQHTAARRRLLQLHSTTGIKRQFQHTAARRRLPDEIVVSFATKPSFNTQPPEGGCTRRDKERALCLVSTHSRPKAAASNYIHFPAWLGVSTHSRPKAAASVNLDVNGRLQWFQHTAARRRLLS